MPYDPLCKPGSAVDQLARDLAQKAVSGLTTHERICEKIEEANHNFRTDVREWLERIQEAYKDGMIQLRATVATEISATRMELGRLTSAQDQELEKCMTAQDKVNSDLYAKVWMAVVGWAGLMTTIAVGAISYIFLHH